MEQYIVTGMSCAACQARVEKAVNGVQGVTSCSVSLLTNSMGVEGSASSKDIIRAVENAGYGASLKGAQINRQSASERMAAEEDALIDRETPKLKRRLSLSVIFLCLLMYVSMGHNMAGFPVPSFLEHNHLGLALVQMCLAIIVMMINGKFFTSGYKALWMRSPNMDTLVALGSTASFGWSLYVLFEMTCMITNGSANMDLMPLYHNELYFESAAMIPCLITIGKMLEAKSKGRTTDALKSLMKLAPKTAVILKEGMETEVGIDEVSIGDIFIVKAGENIPVDGIVVEGNGAVNESALTGESIPVDKTAGDKVSAATTNQSGYLKCQATRVGEDTTLSQIIHMVSDAAATKAPIARIADTVSGYFVPFVIAVALLTTCGWLIAGQTMSFALARGISVLVISCPCALGLATPVAIMVGNGLGAKNGILFKTSEALENAGKVQIVALDKTGTITSGEPVVTDIYPLEEEENDFLKLAYSLEIKSEHPLAKAIVKEAEKRNITAYDTEAFQVVAGNGLQAVMQNKTVFGGNKSFISSFASIPDSVLQQAQKYAEEGKTPLFFAKGKELQGIIAVADTIKEDSNRAIQELQNMGIHVVMLTGDNEKTANAIGKQAGVDEVIAGVLPDGKEAVIKQLQKQGKTAMVGDGINDAPALTRADTGIAIGAGTDVAIDSADIVLMNSKLSDVSAAIRLSRKTLRNIHENLFWAFFYNLICIPLAAGLFKWKMNPMVGAAAMSLSSFTVCMNALRLNLFHIHDASKDKKINFVQKENVNKETEKQIIHVEGMMCEHCESVVQKALESIAGVQSAKADHTTGIVEMTVTKTIPMETVDTAVSKAGYRMKKEEEKKIAFQKTFKVEGMMCEHCEATVKKALEELDGVVEASANHHNNEVRVSFSKDANEEEIRQAIENKGYTFKGEQR